MTCCMVSEESHCSGEMQIILNHSVGNININTKFSHQFLLRIWFSGLLSLCVCSDRSIWSATQSGAVLYPFLFPCQYLSSSCWPIDLVSFQCPYIDQVSLDFLLLHSAVDVVLCMSDGDQDVNIYCIRLCAMRFMTVYDNSIFCGYFHCYYLHQVKCHSH